MCISISCVLTSSCSNTHIDELIICKCSQMKDHLGIIFGKMILAYDAFMSTFMKTILWRYGQCLDTK